MQGSNNTNGTRIGVCERGSPKVNASIYSSLISSLFYISSSRPEIVHVVSMLSRFIQLPYEIHFVSTKRVLGCLERHSWL